LKDWLNITNLKEIVTRLSQTKNGRPVDLPLIIGMIGGARRDRTVGLLNAIRASACMYEQARTQWLENHNK